MARANFTSVFRWLHVSDIHLGHGAIDTQQDQTDVLAVARADIKTLVGDGNGIDAIFVTGDIAFSGGAKSQKEYTQATDWLRSIANDIGVEPTRIYVIPGNHDINRRADDTKDIYRMVNEVRTGRASIDEALNDETDRQRLRLRLENYLTFSKSFAPANKRATPADLYWKDELSIGAWRFRIAGLNTALVAGDEKKYLQPDHGHLTVGRSQLFKLLDRLSPEPGVVQFLLSHHPFQKGWIREERELQTWLARVDIHLCGHVHVPELSAKWLASQHSSTITLSAGAAHMDAEPISGVQRPVSHSFSLGQITTSGNSSKARVRFRRWSADRRAFVDDSDLHHDGESYCEYPLSVQPPERKVTVLPKKQLPVIAVTASTTRKIRATDIDDSAQSKIRKYWSTRDFLLGMPDARQDFDHSSQRWFSALFLKQGPGIGAVQITGQDRVIVGRKGAGKSAVAIAAQREAEQTPLSPAVHVLSLEDGVEDYQFFLNRALGDSSLLSASWRRALFCHLIKNQIRQRIPNGEGVVAARGTDIREWVSSREPPSTPTSVVALAREALSSTLNLDPDLIFVPGLPVRVALDEFDSVMDFAPSDARLAKWIQSAIEAGSKISGSEISVVLLLREDYWLLARPGWAQLDKVSPRYLRWDENGLGEWLRRRLAHAVALALGQEPEDYLGHDVRKLWRIFFPPKIQLADDKESDSLSYVIRRTLYVPRDLQEYVVSIERVSSGENRWPVSPKVLRDAEEQYSLTRLTYLQNEFGGVCSEISELVHSFTAKPLEWTWPSITEHLSGFVKRPGYWLRGETGGDPVLTLVRFLVRIGFLEIRYRDKTPYGVQTGRFEVRDAFRHPDCWASLMQSDDTNLGVRSVFYRALRSHADPHAWYWE